MNTSKYFVSLFLIAAPFFPMLKQSVDGGIIKGSVTPQNAAQHVMAISSKDTAEADVKIDGTFELDGLKIGNYTVIIVGRAPYKQTVKDDVVVSDGSFTDLGTITMEQ